MEKYLAAFCLVLGMGRYRQRERGRTGPPFDPQPQPRPAPDFLFGEPRESFGIRVSRVFARSGSDLYDFINPAKRPSSALELESRLAAVRCDTP